MMGLVRAAWNRERSGAMGNTRAQDYLVAQGQRYKGYARSWAASVVNMKFWEESSPRGEGNMMSCVCYPASQESAALEP